MTDSEFWKDLARQFREHIGSVSLSWIPSRQPRGSRFDFSLNLHYGATRATEMALRALCLQAGIRLDPSASNPTISWLTKMTTHVAADVQIIRDLASVSAQACSDLQMLVLQAEHDSRKASTIPSGPASTSEHIEQLRIEAGLTQQDLADLVGVDIRNVQHHLANTHKPSKLTLARYEREFSNLLRRKIVITKTP